MLANLAGCLPVHQLFAVDVPFIISVIVVHSIKKQEGFLPFSINFGTFNLN